MSVVVSFLEDWRVFKIPISCFPMKSVKTRSMSVSLETGRGSEARNGGDAWRASSPIPRQLCPYVINDPKKGDVDKSLTSVVASLRSRVLPVHLLEPLVEASINIPPCIRSLASSSSSPMLHRLSSALFEALNVWSAIPTGIPGMYTNIVVNRDVVS